MEQTKNIIAVIFAAFFVFTIGCATTPSTSSSLKKAPHHDRIVAVGDVHGSFGGLVAILREASLIDEANRWIGGNTLLVQTGDILDRGEDVKAVMDLLMSLQHQAQAAGGKVVVLMGNHEAMNIVGSLIYLNPDACQDFIGPGSAEKQAHAFERWQAFFGASAGPEGGDSASIKQKWLTSHPPGFVEYTEALGPDGRYGKWLRSLPATFRYGGTVFLHAGISPDYVEMSPSDINADIATQIAKVDEIKSYLMGKGYIEPFFSLSEMISVVNGILKAAETEEMPPSVLKALDRLREIKSFMDTFYDESALMVGEGPLWFRGFAQWPDDQLTPYLPQWLVKNDVWRVVVSHTPRQDGRIQARLDGSIFLIDTGMNFEFYKGGRPSALEIKNDDVAALYLNEKRVVFSPPQIDYGPAHVWTDPNGAPLPFDSADEVETFLLTASPASTELIFTGVNRPQKVLLEKNGLQVNAIFRYQSEIEGASTAAGSYAKTRYFRDSYLGEIAAYEMNRILGLNNMPPTVLRKIANKEGTLQLWAEQTMPDRQRAQDNKLPPEALPWNKQMWDMRVFDNLINNVDRNQTNILIDRNWRLILIDHTRTFARDKSLPHPEQVLHCSRGLWHALRHLDEAKIRERLSSYLVPAEINAMFLRRNRLVELIQDLINRNGEEAILF